MSELYSLVMSILLIIGMWKIFEKANVAGWKSIIPFYGPYVEWKILRKPGFFWLQLVGGILAGLAAGLMLGSIFTAIGLETLLVEETIDEALVTAALTGPLMIFGVLVLFATSIVMLIVNIVRAKQYKKVFNLSTGMAVGIFFLPEIFLFVIGIDQKYQYDAFNLELPYAVSVNNDPWQM